MFITLQKILPEALAATLIQKAIFDNLWKHAVS
jgi:hypothetical protein